MAESTAEGTVLQETTLTHSSTDFAHEPLLRRAQTAIIERKYWAPFAESPKAYSETGAEEALAWFQNHLNQDFTELTFPAHPESTVGEEVSPYLQLGLGIRYPAQHVDALIDNALEAWAEWRAATPLARANVLAESLERLKPRFFDIAQATMHTTGQAFMMAFQASGPHAADRAMEAVALALEEQERFPAETQWVKPMGKFELNVRKTYRAVPRGLALVVGCSTFPTWNTVPGLYASLATGNPVIIKPHPKAVLPIAIVIAELQKALEEAGFNPALVQLAPDTSEAPITKLLAEHPAVKIVDFTGSSNFGGYLESLQADASKIIFTEKAGVNPVLIHSTAAFEGMCGNIAMAASLYSGQMCTAPQNIFLPADGIETEQGVKTFDEVVEGLRLAFDNIATNPKMAAGVLGALQSDATLERIKTVSTEAVGISVLESQAVANAEFAHARIASPLLRVLDAAENHDDFQEELFGPIVNIIKTADFEEALALAVHVAAEHGAISCGAYATSELAQAEIADAMAFEAFTPVAFNLTTPFYLMNQNAAFSDFHVSGGNPSGNAALVDPAYVNRRFVWVGAKYAH